ncbi:MAG: hypothetical protein ACREAN_05350 [Nitrosopumilaceae archaeon]
MVTAAILLTSVAIIGSALVTWSNSNLKSFETLLVTNSANMTNQINENLVIENVAFCANCNGANSRNVINVTLTNTGTLGVQVDKIQINSTAINTYFVNQGGNLPAAILPQKSYTVTAQLPTNVIWHSKSLDTITITTHRGSTLTTQGAPS